MAYKKVGWKDYPSTDTPINATNLDHMDAGILENAQTIGDKTKISGIGDGTVAGAIAANKSAIDANAEAIAQNTQSLTKEWNLISKMDIFDFLITESNGFVTIFCSPKKNDPIPNASIIGRVPDALAPKAPTGYKRCGIAYTNRPTSINTDKSLAISAQVLNNGDIIISNDYASQMSCPCFTLIYKLKND